MNRKILAIAIALLFVAIVAAPVSAIPTKSPLPTANPWNIVWGLNQDLQNQITANFANLQGKITALQAKDTALEAKDTNLQNQINNIPGPVHFEDPSTLFYSNENAGNYEVAASPSDGIVSCLCEGNLNSGGIAAQRAELSHRAGVCHTEPYRGCSFEFPVKAGSYWIVSWDDCNYATCDMNALVV